MSSDIKFEASNQCIFVVCFVVLDY